MCDCPICTVARELVARDDYVPEALCLSARLAAAKRGEFGRGDMDSLDWCAQIDWDFVLTKQAEYFLAAVDAAGDPRIAAMASAMAAFRTKIVSVFGRNDLDCHVYERHARDVHRAVRLERGLCMYPGAHAQMSFKYLSDRVELVGELDRCARLQDEIDSLHAARASDAAGGTAGTAVEVAILHARLELRRLCRRIVVTDEKVTKMGSYIQAVKLVRRESLDSCTLVEGIFTMLLCNALNNLYRLFPFLQQINEPALGKLVALVEKTAEELAADREAWNVINIVSSSLAIKLSHVLDARAL